jgi:hypothetical protein
MRARTFVIVRLVIAARHIAVTCRVIPAFAFLAYVFGFAAHGG